MEKEQSRLKIISEIRKDRVGNYPYFIVATTYSAQDHHFIIAADYRGQYGELCIYPFKNDMARLTTTILSLADILTRKPISTIHVNNFSFRPNANSITILQAQFILGYRSGHLVVAEYKDRDFKVKQRLNRGLKNEGFFSRASSAIFGGQDSYTTYFKLPIRSFTINPLTPDYYHIWQVGNNIMLQRQLSEDKQGKFLTRLEAADLDNFHMNYDANKPIKDGEISLYGCEYYTYFGHPESKIFFLCFKEEVNSYANILSRKEIAVSLTSKEQVLLIDHTHFALKTVISLQIPIRNITTFFHEEKDYLAILPYENHFIIYNLANNRYCKMRGHRSYVASVHYNSAKGRITTAGMDHCMCFMKIAEIEQESWVNAQKGANQTITVSEFNVPDQKFLNIFRINEYSPNRTNQSSYGFASQLQLNGHLCFCTYDTRIIVYAPF